jgi:WxcM-like, C-terminal
LGKRVSARPAPSAPHRSPAPRNAGSVQPRLVELPKIHDIRGNLTFIEGDRHIPFAIKRLYYLYDVPGGVSRGGHAHRRLHQLIVAISGSFDVTVDDGTRRQKYTLNRSYFGLYVPPMHWRDLDNFSSGSVCIVAASEVYEAGDYLYDYDEFLAARRRRRSP